MVAIAVRDTGVGIPEADHGKVFEDFRQLDSSPARGYGGTGLGLSICRRLAHMLGGNIELRAAHRAGARHSLCAFRPARDAVDVTTMTGPAKPLVLVVEDYQDAREMYAAYLQFSGYRVAEATNGVEAIDKTVELMPDIILMDLALPRMDGWEATRRLKMDERTRHIPIVALTGHALAGHAEGARQAGCDSFVTKPCLPDALVAEIQRMLSGSAPDSARHGPRASPGAPNNPKRGHTTG